MTVKAITRRTTVTREQAHQVWQTPDGSWTWYVLKHNVGAKREQTDPYASVFCEVVSPYTPWGEIGDTFISDIRKLGGVLVHDAQRP